MLNGLFLSVNNVALESWIEVTWIAQDFQEAANTVLRLVLSLSLDVDREMRVVEVAKHSIEQLKIFERRFVIKLNQRQVAHERRPV